MSERTVQTSQQPIPIKMPLVERSILASYKSGSIEMTPANSIYLLVPADLVGTLINKYGLDLPKHRKQMTIRAHLVEERPQQDPSAPTAMPFTVGLLYTIEAIFVNGKNKKRKQ